MSRCFSREKDDRIDSASAYMLGLLIFHNEGRKSTKIMSQVKNLGYSQMEAFEALQLLISTNLVESHVQRCLTRKVGVNLTEYARNMPMSDLFKKVNSMKSGQGLVEGTTSFLAENSDQIAKGAGVIASLAL